MSLAAKRERSERRETEGKGNGSGNEGRLMADARRAVFLDRDGVLNYNRSDHIKSPEEYVPIPGAAEAVARLRAAGWRVILVSNQSGLGRGLFDQTALDAVMARMCTVLKAAGGGVDGVYYCPHAPGAGCVCRKPQPGLLLRAAREHGLDLPRSYVVGDKAGDIECGRAVRARTILVETGLPEERPDLAAAHPDYVASDLSDAVAWILQEGCR
jgi:histidinol-phosphate phosphatase family protein